MVLILLLPLQLHGDEWLSDGCLEILFTFTVIGMDLVGPSRPTNAQGGPRRPREAPDSFLGHKVSKSLRRCRKCESKVSKRLGSGEQDTHSVCNCSILLSEMCVLAYSGEHEGHFER